MTVLSRLTLFFCVTALGILSGCQLDVATAEPTGSKHEITGTGKDLKVTGASLDYQFSDAVVHLAALQNSGSELDAFDELIVAIKQDGYVAGYEKRLLEQLLVLEHPGTLAYYHYSAPYADLVEPSDALRERIRLFLDSLE